MTIESRTDDATRDAQFMRRANAKAPLARTFAGNEGADVVAGRNNARASARERAEPAIFARNRALLGPGKRAKTLDENAPIATLGRYSWGGANPEVEAAHAELRERKRKFKALARARKSSDVDVDDDKMAAAAFAVAGRSGKKKGAKRDFVKPEALGAVKRAKTTTTTT